MTFNTPIAAVTMTVLGAAGLAALFAGFQDWAVFSVSAIPGSTLAGLLFAKR